MPTACLTSGARIPREFREIEAGQADVAWPIRVFLARRSTAHRLAAFAARAQIAEEFFDLTRQQFGGRSEIG